VTLRESQSNTICKVLVREDGQGADLAVEQECQQSKRILEIRVFVSIVPSDRVLEPQYQRYGEQKSPLQNRSPPGHLAIFPVQALSKEF